MAVESLKKLKDRAATINAELAREYPTAECALHHRNPFELLAATILSAQCTDARVNLVTPALFNRFPDAQSMAAADTVELEELIKPTGFFRAKTKSLQGMACGLVEWHEGEVPRTMEELIKLPGVGRKTANVVLGNCFDTPGLTVDTHMQRVNQRLGLTRNTDAVKIERDLMRIVPQDQWTLYSHRVIMHGRAICVARKPRCGECPLRPWCEFYKKIVMKAKK